LLVELAFIERENSISRMLVEQSTGPRPAGPTNMTARDEA
jgi:hypothetical protein